MSREGRNRSKDKRKAEAQVRRAAKKVVKKARKHRGLAAFITIVLIVGLIAGLFFYDYKTHKISDWMDGLLSREGNTAVPLDPAEGDLLIHFVDVGQGDCIILQFPDGKNMVIDGGDSTNATKSAVLGYIEKQNIEEFEYCMLTHTDEDHCGSLDDIVNAVNVKNFYVPGVTRSQITTKTYGKFLDAVEANGERVEDMAVQISESRMTFGSAEAGYMFYIIVPEAGFHETFGEPERDAHTKNAISPIMFLKYGGLSVCFTGDSNVENEPDFLRLTDTLDWTGDGRVTQEDRDFYDCDILKVAHHGSRTSSTQDFLDVVKPEISVISAGEGNSYNHPEPELLSRLAGTFNSEGVEGSKVYCTIDYGDVVIKLTGKDGETRIDGIRTSKTPEPPASEESGTVIILCPDRWNAWERRACLAEFRSAFETAA